MLALDSETREALDYARVDESHWTRRTREQRPLEVQRAEHRARGRRRWASLDEERRAERRRHRAALRALWTEEQLEAERARDRARKTRTRNPR